MQIELTVDHAGHKAGTRFDVPDATAKAYIDQNKAKAFTPAPTLPDLPDLGGDGATLSGTVSEGIHTLIAGAFELGVKAAEGKGAVRPDIVSQLGQIGRFAEAKEEKQFGEWLWALGHSTTHWNGTSTGQKASNLMQNKYKSKFNPNFGKDFEQSAHTGSAFDMQTKASVQVEDVGALGGFTVPVEFYPSIIKVAYDESELFRRISKYQMNGRELLIPALDYSKGGSGASPYLAGMVANWFAENVTLPQTNASVRQVSLVANLLGGYTQASRTLLADNAVGFQQILTELMGQTIAFYVTKAVVSGTGANQPRGFTNESAAISVARTGDTTAGTMLADMSTMKSKLLPGSAKRAMWMIAPSTEAFLTQMNDASSHVVYLPNFPLANNGMGGPASYPGMGQVLGIPVEVNQYAASHGSVNDLILVDPAGYAWGERQDIEIGVSEHVAFLSNLLTWRFLFRGDGRSKLNTYLTLQNGDTVSPFVFRAA